MSIDSEMVDSVRGFLMVSPMPNLSSILQDALLSDVTNCSSVVRLTCGEAAACGRPALDPNNNLPLSKVVNGEVAERGAWPWLASINLFGRHHCTGSILSDRWVLTAAHCHVTSSGLSVHVGSALATGGASHDLQQFIAHENYTHASRAGHAVKSYAWLNDIALIQLADPIAFDDVSTQPVCLGEAFMNERSFSRCYVAGWGSTLPERGPSASRLRQAKQSILPTAHCTQFYEAAWQQYAFVVPYQSPIHPDNHVCVGQEDAYADACWGDSGGPLSCEDAYGNWVVHGVVSFGATSKCVEFSVYERVSTHLHWIRQTMRDNA